MSGEVEVAGKPLGKPLVKLLVRAAADKCQVGLLFGLVLARMSGVCPA
jgi:hypothetical protein